MDDDESKEASTILARVSELLRDIDAGRSLSEVERLATVNPALSDIRTREAVLEALRSEVARRSAERRRGKSRRRSSERGPLDVGRRLLAAKIPDVSFGVKLLRPLGSHGQGEVWLARGLTNWKFRGRLAVKVFHREAKRQNRASTLLPARMAGANLFRELQSLRGVQHPNVVRVLDGFETADRHLCLFLEYVPEWNLQQWATVHRKNGMAIREAAALIGMLADVLQNIAVRAGAGLPRRQRSIASKMIHGDIKPSNILGLRKARPDYQLEKVKLSDFGTAMTELVANSPYQMGVSQYGTVGYMAPEQFTAGIEDEVSLTSEPRIARPEGLRRTVAIDVFALAMTFLSLISPFDENAFLDRVGTGNPQWAELHKSWKTGSRSLFNVISRGGDEPLPDATTVLRFFEELNLPGLIDRLLPGRDEETTQIRAILRRSVATHPQNRFQTPGELAVALAKWLRVEDIQVLERGAESWLGVAMARSRRLSRRFVLWGLPDDGVAMGAKAWWVPGGVCGIVFVIFLSTTLSIDQQLLASLIAFLLLLGATVVQQVVLLLAVRSARKKRQMEHDGLDNEGNLGSARTRPVSLLAEAYDLFKSQFPIWGAIPAHFVMWVVVHCKARDPITDEQMQKLDVAHMLGTYCLFMGIALGAAVYGGKRRLLGRWAVPGLGALGIALWSQFTTPAPGYNERSGMLIYGFYTLFLIGYTLISYVGAILLGWREKSVAREMASETARRRIFLTSSSSWRCLERDTIDNMALSKSLK